MPFNDFCGGQVWNNSLTWDTDYPEFSDCFLRTVNTWLPCGFLLLSLLPYYFAYLRTLPTLHSNKYSKLHLATYITTIFFLLLHITSLLHNTITYSLSLHPYLPIDLLTPAIYILTFSVSLWLLEVERRKRLVTSGIHFIFFLLLFLSTLVFFVTIISRQLKGDTDRDVFQVVIMSMQSFLSLLQLILLSFPHHAHYDSIPPSSFTKENRVPCPENRASFISRVFFNWIRNIVYLGYKKSLTEKDLFDLNPRDQTRINAARLERAWMNEVDICKKYNQKYTKKDFNNDDNDNDNNDNENQSLLQSSPVAFHGTFNNKNDKNKSNDYTKNNYTNNNNNYTKNNYTNNSNNITNNLQNLFSNNDIHQSDLGPIDPIIPPRITLDPFKFKSPKKPNLFKVLFKIFGLRLFLSHFIKVFCDLLLLSGPLIQSLVIDFIEASSGSSSHPWQGYLYGVLFFLNSIVYTILFQWVFHIGMNVGMRINSSVVALIYKKALTMDSEARRTSTVGEVVNLMAVDAQRIQDATAYLWMLWSSPLQIVLSLALLWNYMGPSIFAGMAVMVFMIPLNAVVATMQKRLQIEQMRKKDERIKVMNEVLNGIKVIKLYAWETSFREKVSIIRSMELSTLKKFCYLAAVLTFSWSCAPFLVTLATFATYVCMGGVLDAKKAFTALSLFNILRVPISILPMVVTFIIMAAVSTTRICTFLQTSDLKQDNVLMIKSSTDAIRIEDGTFGWSKSAQEVPLLNRINLTISKGSLTAVVGQVGVGKTSLIAAMLGDMEKKAGRVVLDGSVGYVSQQAWIQNATLKDNILFGMPFNQQKYKQVLDVCAMTRDLEILPGGDMTEIGEKGINLSGGQKQRVSLARAIYQDCDVYLLDDPLSAVDSHVAKHIFKYALGPQGMLKNKTRVLVTHGITWLPRCDVIVVMAEGGIISESGSYQGLLNHSVEFAKFIREFLMQSDDGEGDGEGGDDGGEGGARRIPTRSSSIDGGDEEDDDGDDDDFIALSPDTRLSEEMSSIDRKKEVKKMLLEKVSSLISDDDGVGVVKKRRKKKKRKTEMIPLEESVGIGNDVSPDVPLIVTPSLSGFKMRNIGRKRGKSMMKDDGGMVVEDRSKIISDEITETGHVKLMVYWIYIKSVSFILSLFFIIAFILFQVSALLSNFWLSMWTNDPLIVNATAYRNTDIDYLNVQVGYLAGYGGFGLLQAFFIMIYALVSAQANVNSSHELHKKLLARILRAPMSFFDTTPIGRILNRFSKDIEMVDNNLISGIRTWLNTFCNIISTIIVISYSTPIFLTVVLPVFFLYFVLQRFYMPTTRQLKRLESTTKSPIYNHFSETISGASVIRSFSKQQQFINRSQYLVDHNMSIYFANITSNRWLSIILDTMGGVIILFATVFAVMSRFTLSPSIVGLSISYALQITVSMTWLVRMSTQLETNIVSVERILEYSNTPSEADWHEGTTHPSSDWPSEGAVEFKDFGLRYRQNLELVLKNVNLDVKSGEKIGIVGRTGAGKSSMTLALFRIIEAAEGGIMIDGVDISKLGLYKLRSSITILPQDPVLFSGSLRSNLDPTERYTDKEVWTALEHAHLKAFVSNLPQKLMHECGEGGENLSVGQRQLICLGRTLLRKTKVLILDEATAAVDLETDKVIQETIRAEFTDCTVLTIAHRINTILNCDRVMVMDAGTVVEFDSPTLLLSNRSSYFFALAKDAGIVS